jgi:hypothetical protein
VAAVSFEQGEPFDDPFQDMGSEMGANVAMDVPEMQKADLSFAVDFAEDGQIEATPLTQGGIAIFPTPLRREPLRDCNEQDKDDTSCSQKCTPLKSSALTKIAASWIKEKVKEPNETRTFSELTQSVTFSLSNLQEFY